MAIIRKPCKFCGKTTDITSEIDLGSSRMLVFGCGHSTIEEKLSNITKEQSSDTSNETVLSLFEQLKNEIPSHCEIHDRNCIKAISSHTGKHLFPYQRDGIVKAYENNAKFIFNDEMGLGKTIQALGTILLNPEKLLPAIFVCKSIAKTNMLWEVMDILQIPAQVIWKTSETPFDIFKVHIISYDMMNRLDKMFKFSDMKPQVYCPQCDFRCDEGKHEFCPTCKQIKDIQGDIKQTSFFEDGKEIIDYSSRVIRDPSKIVKLIPWFDKSIGVGSSLKDENKREWTKRIQNCKTIILDEVHLLKNPSSQRSKALKTVASLIPHKICLSGTLIKNNATEYFIPLNIVYPEKYWRYESFCRNNVRFEAVRTVTGSWANKFTGLIDPRYFMESVKHCMIRRTTDEVLPELPKLFRQPKYVELEEKYQEIYDESEKDFAKWFDNASSADIRMDLLARLAQLRHQTSLAKVDFTIDLALEFIMTTERKLAIFTHHIDSREFLAERMINFFKETQNGENVVRILGRGKDVQEEIAEFSKSGTERILILSTLAHGESINLQFMSDCILHERQWNPANEDQAISGRFRRIGQEAKSILCQIPVAIGTIDEHFVEIVERKRAISREQDTGEIESWNEGFVAELAEKIASKGRSKWKL